MWHSKLITKENIDGLFDNLSKEYIDLGGKQRVDIYIVGGAAIVLNFDYRMSTIDIDAYYKENQVLVDAILNVSNKLGLPNDWLNHDFTSTPSYSPEIVKKAVLHKGYGNIIFVYLLEPRYLIAMKLKSSRPTGGDLDDIVKMIYELRLKEMPISYDMVIEAYQEMYEDFSNTYEYFLTKTKDAFEVPLEDISLIVKGY